MLELGVTLDAVAVLRETRRAREPDPVQAAFAAEQAGAAAINVQLRGDRRHVQERDINVLRETVQTELNLTVNASQEMARFTLTAKPHRVTFVPERIEDASAGGLDIILNVSQMKQRVAETLASSILPVVYIDPSIDQVKAAHQIGALGVELSAAPFVTASSVEPLTRDRDAVSRELQRLDDCARLGAKLGLHVSASHALTLRNVLPLLGLSGLSRVNIGHAIAARAMMTGFHSAVREWVSLLESKPSSS